jgi:3-phosphoshikimate 1-carboxyvinyltransferase
MKADNILQVTEDRTGGARTGRPAPVRQPMTVRIDPAARLRGRLRVPGDKSISHRYALLAALADGRSRIGDYAPGADCRATLACLAALGVEIAGPVGGRVEIAGRGLRGLRPAAGPLDARNSGTTCRLLAGVLAAHRFRSVIVGDGSLSRRPMRRVIDPLARMGATLEAAGGDRLPLTIVGADLHGIDYAPPVPSAQVKSAVLLAGLQAEGETTVREPALTRDHTERALAAFGVSVSGAPGCPTVAGGQRLRAVELTVPGDISSAAFFGVAAAALPGSEVVIDEVGLNPTRTAWLDVLRRAGATVEIEPRAGDGEPSGTIRIRHGAIAPFAIAPDEVPGLIDELPALAALGALGAGMSVTGASELRAKESDRISMLVAGLRALGVEAEELPDGFVVAGGSPPTGGRADAAGDHRLVMAFAVAALGARSPSEIEGAEAVEVSYPEFFEALRTLAT